MISVSVANEFGAPKKKPTHRGGKPRGKPGSSHLASLQAAHGKGDFKAAKVHALNYANAIHKSTTGSPPNAVGMPNEPNDGAIAATGSDTATEQTGISPTPPAAASNNRATLAKLAMSLRK